MPKSYNTAAILLASYLQCVRVNYGLFQVARYGNIDQMMPYYMDINVYMFYDDICLRENLKYPLVNGDFFLSQSCIFYSKSQRLRHHASFLKVLDQSALSFTSMNDEYIFNLAHSSIVAHKGIPVMTSRKTEFHRRTIQFVQFCNFLCVFL